MKRFYLIFEGQVQGVGFRSTLKRKAIQLECTGWVRNMLNGKVEAELQGTDENIKFLLRSLRQENQWIRIENIASKEIPVINESHFIVRY